MNRRAFQSLQVSSETPWIGSCSSDPETTFCLLFDTVHLFKCLRNNWLSEKCKEISLSYGEEHVVGKWKDVVSLYEKEAHNDVKRTALTKQTCYPSCLELQKVSLVCNVFDDKTVAALKCDGKNDTAKFIQRFLTTWKIVNVKNPVVGGRWRSFSE